jgi:hypothetical protein
MPKKVDLVPTVLGLENGAKPFTTTEVNAREVLKNSDFYKRKPREAVEVGRQLAPSLEEMTDLQLKMLILQGGGDTGKVGTRADLLKLAKETVEKAFVVTPDKSEEEEQNEIAELRNRVRELGERPDMRWKVDRLKAHVAELEAKERQPRFPAKN